MTALKLTRPQLPICFLIPINQVKKKEMQRRQQHNPTKQQQQQQAQWL